MCFVWVPLLSKWNLVTQMYGKVVWNSTGQTRAQTVPWSQPGALGWGTEGEERLQAVLSRHPGELWLVRIKKHCCSWWFGSCSSAFLCLEYGRNIQSMQGDECMIGCMHEHHYVVNVSLHLAQLAAIFSLATLLMAKTWKVCLLWWGRAYGNG